MAYIGKELCIECWVNICQNLRYAQVNMPQAAFQFYQHRRNILMTGDWRYFFALMLRMMTGRIVCPYCLSLCMVLVTPENANQVRHELELLRRRM